VIPIFLVIPVFHVQPQDWPIIKQENDRYRYSFNSILNPKTNLTLITQHLSHFNKYLPLN
jgi:hypothetical protein